MTESGSDVLVKGGILFGMSIVLLIPLALLLGLVSERTSLREEAYARVARGYGGAQVVGGPMLVVPVHAGQSSRNTMYVLPADLDYSVELRPADVERRVGIFEVPVYEARIEISGHFDADRVRRALHTAQASDVDWNASALLLPVSDPRGIRELSASDVAFVAGDFHPASGLGFDGLAAPLRPVAPENQDDFSFSVSLVVGGSRAFSVLPLGARTTMELSSSWPHPSFTDTFLPATKRIRDDGFDAQWTVLEVNRAFGQSWLLDPSIQAALTASAFGVNLYQPVDAYQRVERAVKYACLFVAFTFMAFFCYERVRRLRLHPVQYALVGLALSVFYLLLLALSEHLPFAIAYFVATAALVALLGTYIAGALHSRRQGASVAGCFALMYLLLYALLLSEDYALLVGALAVFVLLAAIMLVTRRVDWYSAVQVS
jgi:inner membrane protein